MEHWGVFEVARPQAGLKGRAPVQPSVGGLMHGPRSSSLRAVSWSGKSGYAQKTRGGPPRTASLHPDLSCDFGAREMAQRVKKTSGIEKDLRLGDDRRDCSILPARSRRSAEYRVLPLDCLTLWINNLLLRRRETGRSLTGGGGGGILPGGDRRLGGLSRNGHIGHETELGMGIIPDNETPRRFRDCAGRCNQMMAEAVRNGYSGRFRYPSSTEKFSI